MTKEKLTTTTTIKMPLWAYVCVNTWSACAGMVATHFGLIKSDEIPFAASVGVVALAMPFIVRIVYGKIRKESAIIEPFTAKDPWGEK